MNISLMTPHGELINKSTDGYSILKIEYEPYNRYYLKVVTNNYFDKNEFYKGDVVIIKMFVPYKLSPDQDSVALQQLSSFVNIESGHEITTIGDPNDNGFYKSFYIKGPGAFDEENGVYVIDTSIIDNLVEFNNNYNFDTNNKNGFILNTSLQNSISMTITHEEIQLANGLSL
jgi:hypothetical protein